MLRIKFSMSPHTFCVQFRRRMDYLVRILTSATSEFILNRKLSVVQRFIYRSIRLIWSEAEDKIIRLICVHFALHNLIGIFSLLSIIVCEWVFVWRKSQRIIVCLWMLSWCCVVVVDHCTQLFLIHSRVVRSIHNCRSIKMALAYVDMSSVIEAQVRFTKTKQHSSCSSMHAIGISTIKLNFFSEPMERQACSGTAFPSTWKIVLLQFCAQIIYLFIRVRFITSCKDLFCTYVPAINDLHMIARQLASD